MRTLLDFVLDEPLGEGTNAIVHRARRLPGGETVALKCPRRDTPDAAASLEREARLLGRLRHPNVARLIELVRLSDSDPAVGLAIELIDGPTLSSLSSGETIEPSRLAAIGSDIARGLEALHDVGIVHGDVKPANVVIRQSGQAVLVDLDAAVDEADDSTTPHLVRTTTRFAAPEVLDRGERTCASDVWSLAASLVACVDPARDDAAALPLELRDLLDASLAPDPALRPTLADIIDGFDRASRSSRQPTGPAADLDVPTPERSRPGADRQEGSPAQSSGPADDPTITWRPARTRLADLPSPPAPIPHSGRPARARIGLTVAGLVLGAIGAIGLFAWIADAVRGPQPTLASPPDAEDGGPAASTDRLDLSPSSSDRTDDDASATTSSTTAGAAPAPLTPCATDRPTATGSREQGPEVRRVDADLLAEGCTRSVSWDPITARATVAWPEGPRRYAFGQPGDQLVLGDWDADGRATPALYRPSTGETFTFSGWAEPDAPLPSAEVQTTGIRNGQASARTAIAGTADQLIVERPPT